MLSCGWIKYCTTFVYPERENQADSLLYLIRHVLFTYLLYNLILVVYNVRISISTVCMSKKNTRREKMILHHDVSLKVVAILHEHYIFKNIVRFCYQEFNSYTLYKDLINTKKKLWHHLLMTPASKCIKGHYTPKQCT